MSASTTLAREKQDKNWLSTFRRFRSWKTLARLLLLIAVGWLILTQLHRGELVQAFARLRLIYLVPVVFVFSPLAVLLRAVRWRVLLPDGKRLPLSGYIGSYLVGVLANSLLLGKLGDLVKAKVICDSKLDYGRSLAVVVIDRLLEGAALVLVFASVLLSSSLPGWALKLAWIAGLASVGTLAGLRVLFGCRRRVMAFIERALRRVSASLAGPVLRVVGRVLEGCEVLADYRRVLRATLYALAVWAVEIAAVAVLFTAMSIPAPVAVAATVLLVVLNFGMLIPITPSSIGVYQLLCIFALSLWGVDRELAFALGVVMQTVLFVPLYVAGSVWLLMRKRHVSQDSGYFGQAG